MLNLSSLGSVGGMCKKRLLAEAAVGGGTQSQMQGSMCTVLLTYIGWLRC